MTDCCYKVLQVLQSATVNTKWDVTKVLFRLKNANFLQKIKKADISKIKRALVLKVISYGTTYVCVLMYQISSL